MKGWDIMENTTIKEALRAGDNEQYYGFLCGLADGRIAAQWMREGKRVDHSDLLSGNDSYADGYRDGLKK